MHATSKIFSAAVGSFFACLVSVSAPGAAPLFQIGDGTPVGWGAAIGSGNVMPASNALSTGASQEFYATQIGVNMFGTPVSNVLPATSQVFAVSGLSDSLGQAHDALVMTWQHSPNANAGTLSVAAWDYVYDIDPNLTGTHIKFSILPPPGVWDFSLDLIDNLGRGRGWFGVPPTTNWGSFEIWVDVLGPQGPFAAFHEDPGFDVTMVTSIRLNESSQFGISFLNLLDPQTGGLLIPSGQPWNAWNHLHVAVEPGAVGLFGIGLVGLVLVWRRQRSAATWGASASVT